MACAHAVILEAAFTGSVYESPVPKADANS